MTQEEKHLLLKDLCARLPYGVKCWVSYSKFPTTLVDVNVDANVGDDFFIVTVKLEKTGLNSPSLIEDIRPYLRPMSSMTEEEFKMVCSMNALTDTELRDRIKFPNMFVKNYTIETFDLFNSHHFDYRGLIEKGLALEAPEGMYKTE